MNRLSSIGLALAAMIGHANAQLIPVDMTLVLAVDSSGSVNADEFKLQMAGIAAAFRHPTVLQAIQRGPRGAIAVTLFEWSSVGQQHVSLPWTMVRDVESADLVAEAIESAPRFVVGGSTSISDALRYAGGLLAKSGFDTERRVIDVSGDGSNNNGPSPDGQRDELVAQGIVVNGLAILNDESNLREYFERSVIGGVGSFVMVADDYTSFANSILAKLITEIASTNYVQTAAAQ